MMFQKRPLGLQFRFAGDWRGLQGNLGPPGEQVDLARDAIVICHKQTEAVRIGRPAVL